MAVEEGIFPHQCVHPECDRIVEFDDEPWCFTHSPDEGSSLVGWSAKKALQETVQARITLNNVQGTKSNIFTTGEKLPGEG